MDDALREKLREAIMEARNLKQEAYEETRRRQKADRDLAEASRMVITFQIKEMNSICFKCTIFVIYFLSILLTTTMVRF
jgi:hypothetical protein